MRGTGFVLCSVGIGIGIWTAWVLGWRRVWLGDAAPATPVLPDLVLAGPYRLVRHPRAAAVTMISLGVGFMVDAIPFWLSGSVALVAVLAAVRWDRQRAARFGEAYRRYQRAVPFMVPWRLRPR